MTEVGSGIRQYEEERKGKVRHFLALSYRPSLKSPEVIITIPRECTPIYLLIM